MSIPPHYWTLTQFFLLQTAKYGIKSHAIEYYDDFRLNATQLLVKNMKLSSIKRIKEHSLARKRRQDVMDSMHLKRHKLITKVAVCSIVW